MYESKNVVPCILCAQLIHPAQVRPAQSGGYVCLDPEDCVGPIKKIADRSAETNKTLC